MVDIT